MFQMDESPALLPDEIFYYENDLLQTSSCPLHKHLLKCTKTNRMWNKKINLKSYHDFFPNH